ncbi:sigma-70 family RNA polymerase sigma factor [Mesorhizobium sp.]|uniref:sigma-70 family RNA polymerase sigma factor n=1 Tax=Mesorhizobium sp. TaxID=1871066 RepID=UPI000FE6F784|nr:sigma-70 family RNA polymerase sigma factor [Mesorhizobium sp.]RWM19458.1 MAG: sigma-70 family RNA polymerase sigma factor [Mesorhizobium sp.]
MKRAILNDSELADLMRASQDGDGHAYAALLEAIAPIVRKTVLRQTAAFQRHEAEDIVQDVLVALHVARATYDPARPFLPWLAGIARIRISDTTRRNARRAARELTVADVPETSCAAEANIFGEEYRDPEALRQAIKGLPTGQRQAIELLKLREMSLKEAASFTGMSIAALKVATHRGMTALRMLLVTEG